MTLLNGIRRALIVAAHPDDEVLGCGGTVARLAANGAEVTSLILATGATSRQGSGKADIERLRAAARAAATTLGGRVEFCDFPDNRMDSVALLDVVSAVEYTVRRVQPELVLTHAGVDLNVDHRVTRAAVLTACRPLAGSPVHAIAAFETVSSSEWMDPAGRAFQPTFYVEITSQLERKVAGLSHYESEMRPSPHPRSIDQIRELAHVRGRAAGVTAAEAFEIVRLLERM